MVSEYLERLKVILSSPYRVYKVITGSFTLVTMIPIALYRIQKNREKIWICFDYKTGIHSDFFISIYERLKKYHPELALAVLITPVSNNWRMDQRFAYIHFIPEIFYKKILNKIVIHPTVLSDIYLGEEKNTKHIQINHGFGSFVSVLDEDYIRNVSMFFANTEYQVYQLTDGPYKGHIKSEYVKRIGYPKIDGPVSKEVVIDPDIKAIFYGPTYHREISSIFDFLEPLIGYCSKHKIKLYIKLHPLLTWSHDMEKSGGVDWVKRIRQLQKTHPNVVLLPTSQPFEEVVKIFHQCNLFMTDNSGFGYEFVLMTGRPIIFLGKKLKIPLSEISTEHMQKYQHYPEISARGEIGPVIADERQLEFELDRLLKTGLFAYQGKLEKFRKEFTFNPGAASGPAVDAIMELAKELE